MRYNSNRGREPSLFDYAIFSLFVLLVGIETLGKYVFILLGVVAFGLLIHFRRPLLHAFKDLPPGREASSARTFFMLIFFCIASAAFIGLPNSANSAISGLFGGGFSLGFFYLAGLEVKRRERTFWVRFFSVLFDSLKEIALIFTIVAGLYAAATMYLRHTFVGSETLGELRRLDDRVLYARVFLSTLKFSTLQTIVIAALLLLLRCMEHRWIGQRSTLVDRSWARYQSGTKWMSRIALVALFAASFTLLATREHGVAGEIGARIRDFEKSYTELRAAVAKTLDSELKRKLIGRAWEDVEASERETIQRSIGNYAHGIILNGEYSDLKRSFNFKDDELEKAFSSNKPILEPEFASIVVVANAEAKGAVPDSADGTSLETIEQLSKEAADLAGRISDEPAPEPIKSISQVMKTKLMDYGFDQLKERVSFFNELNNHFPGLGEILDAAWGAGSEAVLKGRKQAKERALQEKLRSPNRPLREIVGREVDDLMRSTTTPKPDTETVFLRGQQVKSRTAELRNTEILLVQKARLIEIDALDASVKRSDEMRSQLDRLNKIEDNPSPTLATPNENSTPPSSSVPSRLARKKADIKDPFHRDAFLPFNGVVTNSQRKADRSEDPISLLRQPSFPDLPRTPPPIQLREGMEAVPIGYAESLDVERRLRRFSDTLLFPDSDLTSRLEKSLRKEREFENQIVAIVGRGRSSHAAELKQILGDDFARFDQIAYRNSAEEAQRKLRRWRIQDPDTYRFDPRRPWDQGERPGGTPRESRERIERFHPVEAPHPAFHGAP